MNITRTFFHDVHLYSHLPFDSAKCRIWPEKYFMTKAKCNSVKCDHPTWIELATSGFTVTTATDMAILGGPSVLGNYQMLGVSFRIAKLVRVL